MPAVVSVTVYDGAETIGGNKIYVENGGSGVFLDFGMNYSRYNEYFNEYLCDRDTRGIHDLLQLNLIPKLNIYRDDLLTSDTCGCVRSYARPDVKAVLLSHAHMDHTGNMGLLDHAIPFVASSLSLAILKAQQDVSRNAGTSAEAAYVKPRVPGDNPLVCGSAGTKTPSVGRDLYGLTEPAARLHDLMAANPLKSKPYRPGHIGHLSELDLPFEVDAYPMDHSICGAVAYRLKSPDGTIFYTGDFRFHGENGSQNMDRLVAGAREANVLIVEGTRTGREGDHPTTESDVYEHCKAAVDSTDKLVIADFSARNFERLEMFARIARETGRELVITTRDVYLLAALECADGRCRMSNLLVYDAISDSKSGCDQRLVEREYADRLLSPMEISRNPGNYILCFSFYDMKHLLDIKPNDGLYIYSSSEAFSEEQEIDHLKLFRWLRHFNIETRGIRLATENGRPEITTEPGYHASGHIAGDELEKFIDRISPDIIIPVHTTAHSWFTSRFHEKVRCLKDGESFSLN
ncbi:MBL fold metallo-hydrolase [Methanocella arvoryzae]|uniref:MBL fold metallo-hydrolase n=1 Tax=Methanocella arvoryzae TaxID=1175445 RepID=UPI001E305B43|nr:MBL fold metallo-hydrolase [Methanocella arvoryzae]